MVDICLYIIQTILENLYIMQTLLEGFKFIVSLYTKDVLIGVAIYMILSFAILFVLDRLGLMDPKKKD